MKDRRIEDGRFFLRDTIRKETDFRLTDQSRGIRPPEVQKETEPAGQVCDLVPREVFINSYSITLADSIDRRQSIRRYSDEALSLKDLSFLLWTTQGIREVAGPAATLRTVPSAGARHSFETYLYIRRVEGLEAGIYRYLPLSHQIVHEISGVGLDRKLAAGAFGQDFIVSGAVTFLWSTIPYRMEWRYGPAAHRVIALDAGHLCQNLYLACGAIGAGTCAVAAFDQEVMDNILRLDGNDEFLIYLAPVGKLPDR